jgi:acyl-coenzyme A thioesterase PaaI-like protein
MADRSPLTAFDAAVAVEARGEGRYAAAVGPSWDGPAAANGGVLAATMVRAVEAELGAGAPPARTIAAHFLDAPRHGNVEIAVDVLRAGKRVDACDVRVRQADRLICQATIVCSARRGQELALRAEPPMAAAAESVDALDLSAVPGIPPLFQQLEIRPAFGSPIFSGSEDAVSGGWVALRGDDAPLDPARLCALTDLWWPAIFGALTAPAAAPTLQLTVHLRTTEHAVSGPLLGRFETRNLIEGHIEECGELWSGAGELLAESRQLALLLPIGPTG